MRRSSAFAELGRLAAPLARVLDALWARMHWWIGAMALLYAASGITVIQPDEVGVVERWGRLVGETPATQEHGPGLLFAFPRPVDRVVRVNTMRVRQLSVRTLGAAPDQAGDDGRSLDPLAGGYALTGDQNIVHVEVVARYRVREPAEWAFFGPKAEDVLRTEVSSAMVRSLGERNVDQVLAEERKDLVRIATERTQAGLDAAHSGLALVSLDLTGLSPPARLANDFAAVQSAYVGAGTLQKEAEAHAQEIVPRAHAEADTGVQDARAHAAEDLALARGEIDAFLALEREYRANPVVVRERLYRDAVEAAIGAAASVRWIPPPPAGGRYEGLRIVIGSSEEGEPDAFSGQPARAPRRSE